MVLFLAGRVRLSPSSTSIKSVIVVGNRCNRNFHLSLCIRKLQDAKFSLYPPLPFLPRLHHRPPKEPVAPSQPPLSPAPTRQLQTPSPTLSPWQQPQSPSPSQQQESPSQSQQQESPSQSQHRESPSQPLQQESPLPSRHQQESPPLPPPQRPSYPLTVPPQEQLKNILDALIGTTDFASWTNILSLLDPSIMPFTVTGFVPDDKEVSNLPTVEFDPSLVPYHIIPQCLSFSELTLFQTNSRLPTLLLNRSILITNNSLENFTLDHTRITSPDLYTSESLALHGIDGFLDYHVYGYPLNRECDSKTPPPSPVPLILPPVAGVGGVKSKGSCLVTRLITHVVLVSCVLSLMGS